MAKGLLQISYFPRIHLFCALYLYETEFIYFFVPLFKLTNMILFLKSSVWQGLKHLQRWARDVFFIAS